MNGEREKGEDKQGLRKRDVARKGMIYEEEKGREEEI